MGANMRIVDRFQLRPVEDCNCVFCHYYDDKKRLCTLGSCCFDDIRQEAFRREQITTHAPQARPGSEVTICHG